MLDFEIELKGRLSDQPPLVRAGSALCFVPFVLLLNFVPIGLAAWLLTRIGAPDAPSAVGWLAMSVLLGGMWCVGAWMIPLWLDWLSAGRIPPRARILLLLAASIAAAAVAAGALIADAFAIVMGSAIVLLFGCAILGSLLIALGTIAARLTSGRTRSRKQRT